MKTQHHIHTINVSPKKGDVILTRWLIEQERPYPCITGNAGRLQWENVEGLLGKYGSKPEGLGSKYRCFLLTPDGDIPEEYNRTHFAGCSHRPGPYGTPEVVNPGTITLRGRDLGEMSVSFGNNPEYPDIKTNGFNSPTHSERDFIKAQIVPHLLAFIEKDRASLRKQALDHVAARLKKEVAEKHAELAALEKMIPEILGNA